MSGFRNFVLRGNVVDLAVGIVIGAAFTAAVNDFVKAFLTPLVGLATGSAGDFSAHTMKIGKTDFPYGAFINGAIALLLTALALYYFVVLPVNRLTARFHRGADTPPVTQECPECLSAIPIDAHRCAFCTVALPAERDAS